MPIYLQIFLCVLLADFLTGFFHWIEDTYGKPSWPLGLGKYVIEPNILHHKKPAAFTKSSFLYRNYQLFLAGLAVAVILYFAGCLTWQSGLVVFLTSFGNETHVWTHARPKNFLARLLIDMAIVQTPSNHMRHHRRPFDRNFCSLTNLVNPILEIVRFWPILEWCLARVGIKPARMTAARDNT